MIQGALAFANMYSTESTDRRCRPSFNLISQLRALLSSSSCSLSLSLSFNTGLYHVMLYVEHFPTPKGSTSFVFEHWKNGHQIPLNNWQSLARPSACSSTKLCLNHNAAAAFAFSCAPLNFTQRVFAWLRCHACSLVLFSFAIRPQGKWSGSLNLHIKLSTN